MTQALVTKQRLCTIINCAIPRDRQSNEARF